MDRGAVTRRRPVDLAWIGLGIGDELGNRLGRHRRIDLHHVRHPHDARNRGRIPQEVEGKLRIERRVDGVRRVDQEQRVAVGGRMNHRLGTDVVAGARLVLDEELLAQSLREPLRHDARGDVRAPAGGIGNDPAHGPGRVVERGGAADSCQGESGEPDDEKAGNVHARYHGASSCRRLFVGRTTIVVAIFAASYAASAAWHKGIGAGPAWNRRRRPRFALMLRNTAALTSTDASTASACCGASRNMRAMRRPSSSFETRALGSNRRKRLQHARSST